MDTLTAFAEPVEDLGRVECLDGRVKAVLLELLSDELEVAVGNLEEVVMLEDELVKKGAAEGALRRQLELVGGDAETWTSVVTNILSMGRQVLDLPSCGKGPPEDLMKRWRGTFGPEPKITVMDII